MCANLFFYGSWTAVWMPRHICMKSSCANLYSHASWTAVCTLGVSQSCDLQFYTHVCLSMLTQPSKTCGNIKHDFIHISVGIVGRRPRRMRTHMCTNLYVCEFIFPRVLDGCVSMLRH